VGLCGGSSMDGAKLVVFPGPTRLASSKLLISYGVRNATGPSAGSLIPGSRPRSGTGLRKVTQNLFSIIPTPHR